MMMSVLAPIVLFTYNRPWHTEQTIIYLLKNKLASDSILYIFSDGGKDSDSWKKVIEVRNFIYSIKGFKKVFIIERETNLGLSNNIIQGVTQILDQHEKVIVLEDDMITSNCFLDYMNTALEFYLKAEEVISIHGYMYPIKEKLPETFFIKGADCWGWGTWKRGWDLFESNGEALYLELKNKKLMYSFDFDGCYPYSEMLRDQIDGKNDSWAIRWYASAFLKNKFTLYVGKSLIQNIGNDSSGTHSKSTENYSVDLNYNFISSFPDKVIENEFIRNRICEYFKHLTHKSFLQILFDKIRVL